MSQSSSFSGPQFRGDRPAEQEAVRTTIVGGRPPGSGKSLGPIPRGIEVLVKKASVDAEFKGLLLAERGEAAKRIGLVLDPAETLMLRAVPASQLEAIIARTSVSQEHRRAFLGQAAAAMLAAMGLAAPGCGGGDSKGPPVTGIAPDRPREKGPTEGERPDRVDIKGERPDKPEPSGEKSEPAEPPAPGENETEPSEPGLPGENPLRPDRIPVPEGIRPERPEHVPVTDGIRPDRIEVDKGIRVDEPPPPVRGIRPDRPPGT